MSESTDFFEAMINAGAILSGFTSTFLVFRIQRESEYFRQPALDFESGKAKDIDIGLTHFTSSFLLIMLATVSSLLFGFLIPLFGLAGVVIFSPAAVVAGNVAAIVLLVGYLADEMIHYRIISTHLVEDTAEWGREAPLLVVIVLLSLASAIITFGILKYAA